MSTNNPSDTELVNIVYDTLAKNVVLEDEQRWLDANVSYVDNVELSIVFTDGRKLTLSA